jgi:tRNA-dihydrouridine synthase B
LWRIRISIPANKNNLKKLLLAPMEDITDLSFRLTCKRLGADFVFTEFVNAEGLVRNNIKTHRKMAIHPDERPIGIQIYGNNIESMVGAAKHAAELKPDVIDINAGCWVKNVVGCGAGAGLLKDPDYLEKLVLEVVKVTSIPVTVKTRIGWDNDSILILEIAERLETVGIAALTVHCRTRSQAHRGEPDWSWINKIKDVVSIPVFLNGGVFTPDDVKRAFQETNADGVMIARGAIDNPWIFRQARELLTTGTIETEIDPFLRINTCLEHLRLAIEIKEEKRGVIEHRKFYTGYLKGLYNASQIRNNLMKITQYSEVENLLLDYLEQLTVRK